MDEKPKTRPFWQIHLSTAVLLVLSIGGCGLLNFVPKTTVYKHDLNEPSKQNGNTDISKQYGWPFVSYATLEIQDGYRGNYAGAEWYPEGFTINMLTALLVLYMTVRLPEWLISRREGRKP